MKKVCPINKFLDCPKDQCAWWNEKEKDCAIKVIAEGIKGLLMAEAAKLK